VTEPLPSALAAHFSTKAMIGVPDLARLLPMDRETIKAHIDAERLVGRFKGFGRIKRQRVFTETDVARFLEVLAGDTACQFSGSREAHSTTSHSTSNVVAFTGRLDAGTRVRQLPSRRKKKPQPAKSSSATRPNDAAP